MIGILVGFIVIALVQQTISQNEISLSFFHLKTLKKSIYQSLHTNRIAVIVILLIHSSLYGLVYYQNGIQFDTLKFWFFVSVLFIIGLIDFKTQFVYTATTICAALVGVGFMLVEFISTQSIPMDYVIGAGIGYLSIGLIVWLTGGMGEGDIEIATIIGLFLGIKLTLLSIMLSFIFGGLGGGYLLVTGSDRKDEMAFGPYLALGAIISMLFGTELVALYMKLLF